MKDIDFMRYINSSIPKILKIIFNNESLSVDESSNLLIMLYTAGLLEDKNIKLYEEIYNKDEEDRYSIETEEKIRKVQKKSADFWSNFFKISRKTSLSKTVCPKNSFH